MEPARDKRGDPAVELGWTGCWEPQWSPLAMSGATVTRVWWAAPG